MGKLKFDRDNLEFREDRASIIDYLKKGLWFLLVSIGLALLYYLLFALFFSTDKEKAMMREKKIISSEYQQLEDKTELLEKVVSNLQERDKNIYRNIFSSDPPYFSSSYQDSMLARHGDTLDVVLINRTVGKLKGVQAGMRRYGILFDEIETILQDTSISFTAIPSIIPIHNFSVVQTGATLGMKVHPFYKTIVMHNGIDLITSVGTTVYASADGVVVKVNRSNRGKGNVVTIDHENGYMTTYSHLGEITVRESQRVKQGDKIARVGTSGTTFAPHLHYEVLLNGNHEDPINYFFADLSPSAYKEMMMIAINTGQSLD